MTREQEKRTREDCRGYCAACTNAQLMNVYRDETKRAEPGEGEVAETAAIFAEEAEKELKRRNLWPV